MSDDRRPGPISTQLVFVTEAELRSSSCDGKERFENRSLADKVARRNTRQRMHREPYRCPHCQGFHLGTPSPGRKKKQVRR